MNELTIFMIVLTLLNGIIQLSMSNWGAGLGLISAGIYLFSQYLKLKEY